MSNKNHFLNVKSSKDISKKRENLINQKVDSIVRKNKKERALSAQRLDGLKFALEEDRKKVKSDSIKKEVHIEENPIVLEESIQREDQEDEPSSVDDGRRLFLKVASVAGLGIAASALFPKSADAYVAGSTPTSNVVGLKDSSNNRINPATSESVAELLTGQGITKLSINLSASGNVRVPASGKKIRVYASRFSLTSDATSVSFRFTSGGTDYEKYVSPKTGGLYGSNNHPNFIEGGIDEAMYCDISGSTTVQINIDYLEV